MKQQIDEKMKEFIDRELSKISEDKEKIAEEKRRIRTEIYSLYKVEHVERTPEQTRQMELLQNYDDMLVQQHDLLCKRDIALFRIVADIGETAMKQEVTPYYSDNKEDAAALEEMS